jgi:hypothetical protein
MWADEVKCSSTLKLLFRLKKRWGWRRRRRWEGSWGVFVIAGGLDARVVRSVVVVPVEGVIVGVLEEVADMGVVKVGRSI